MKRMTRITRRLINPFRGKESGVAFVAVLAFLVIGALIIAPLLGFMFTGLKAGQAHERRTQEFYSADAGIQYAIWHLQYGQLLEDGYVWPSNAYNVTEDVNGGPLAINNDLVDVWIEDLGEALNFKITSTATDTETGSATTVTTHVVPDTGYQGNFFANGVTAVSDITVKGDIDGDIECGGTLTLSPGTSVNGDVKCARLDNFGTINGSVECGTLNNQGVINGIVKYYIMMRQGTISPLPPTVPANPIPTALPPDLGFIETIWPSEASLTSFYLTQVVPEPVEDNAVNSAYYYPLTIVNTCGTLTGIPVGALGVYTGYDAKKGAPRNLSIDTKNPTCAVKLTTTVFVTGDFSVTPNTKLDLNGQTIYVKGTVNFAPGSILTGSGVIIGIGAVTFQPSIVSGGDSGDEAVILHYNGTSWLRQTNTAVGDLNDVWGISGNQVYAVGNGGLVLKYNGASWSPATTLLSALPSPPKLNGVWCNTSSGDVFAVGDAGTILRYNAATTSWSTQTLGTANLNDVWGSSSSGVVYAVGDFGVTWRWESGAWSPLTNDSIQNLNGVWGSEADNVVFAVGDGGTIRSCTGGATTWSTCGSGTLRGLNGIWGVSSSDYFVVGEEGTIRRWNVDTGTGWTTMSVNDGIRPQFRGVWGTSSSNVWAVGEQGTVVHYTGVGSVWTHIVQDPTNPLPGMDIPTTRNLSSVWGSASNDIFAVGQAVKDFIFVQSVNDIVKHLPNGDFYGSIAGKGECTLQPGGQLKAPSDLGRVNFPEYRYMRTEAYIIDQH